jgi:hypothetical protein
MTDERTEADALAQVLTVSVGGEAVELRTLTIDESDAWLRRLTGAVDIALPDAEGDADTLARMLALPAQAALDLVAAYDKDGVLGDTEALRTRMTKRELHEALEAMADAEDPFGEGAARLAAEVFGAPSRFLAAMTQLVLDGLASPTAPSPNGASTPGASTGQGTAAPPGAASASSSVGPTATSGNGRKRRAARSDRGRGEGGLRRGARRRRPLVGPSEALVA